MIAYENAVRRKSLADRLVARSLALALDSEVGRDQAAATLQAVAGRNRVALVQALRRAQVRHLEHPSPLWRAAVDLLRATLDSSRTVQA